MRIVVYDRSCPRLGRVWATGARLYRRLGWIDGFHAVASWDEAVAVSAVHAEIDELQYWGHGKWGCVLAGRDALDARSLARLAPVRDRLAPGALVWFRTCETFGARAGHDFARRAADFFAARVAGHTFVIGARQSGLHALAPGARPDWPDDEGLAEGTPDAPVRARGSSFRAPRTIHALVARLPSWA